jgi:hypothetical protein
MIKEKRSDRQFNNISRKAGHMRTAADHTAKAQKLRHRGEECRTLARLMDTDKNAARYSRMANDYDALTEQEEQLARDVARFNLKR